MADRSADAGGQHVPAPGEDISCALALVNTRFMSAGRPADLIEDAASAARWLAGRGLLPPETAAVTNPAADRAANPAADLAAHLAADPATTNPAANPAAANPAANDPAADPAVAGRLSLLRETIRALFAAQAERRAPAPGDLAGLNAALARAPLLPALTWDDTGPRRGEQAPAPGTDPVDLALARLAADALGVLTGPGDARPAPCGAHGCIRWFLRTHAARQWCSARCGDRVRAARHYARHHPMAGA